MDKGSPIVIKVGGNHLEQPGFIPALAQVVAEHQQRQPCILIHGGGRAVDALMARLGITPSYIDGQRVTDDDTLAAVEMMLTGRVNKDLTLALLEVGVDALGMSGVDRGLIRVEPWSAAMGRVGRVVNVRAEVLRELCAQGVVPVISPISAGPEGRYNVNADHIAGAIAGAVDASHAAFVTDTPGVWVGNTLAEQLSAGEVRELIAQGVIHGGMVPKVNAALDALTNGVHRVVITDLEGLRRGTGTTVVQ